MMTNQTLSSKFFVKFRLYIYGKSINEKLSHPKEKLLHIKTIIPNDATIFPFCIWQKPVRFIMLLLNNCED